MSRRHALIIGASRGIGLGLAQELASRGWQVTATERLPSDLLQEAASKAGGQIEIATADVTNKASLNALARNIPAGSLDLVLVNAGITGAGHQSVEKATPEEVAHVMMTNAVGPAHAGKLALPLLRDGGTLAFTTSRMGSIADSSGGYELYRMSKAAQNILARGIFEQNAKERDIAVLSLHPGWVQTGMGGPAAPLSVQDSANGLANVIERDRPAAHLFLSYDGSEISW